MNETFNGVVDIFLRRIADLRFVSQDGTRLERRKGLLDYLDRFAHFHQANLVAVERVAVLPDRHLELVLFIAAVRIIPPVNAGATEGRTGNTIINGIFRGYYAIANGSLQPDGVLGKQPFIGVEIAGKCIDNFLYIRLKAGRQIFG